MEDINKNSAVTSGASSLSGASAEFDIMSLDVGAVDVVSASNAGAVLQFKDPFVKGRKLPIFVELLGKHSDLFQQTIADRSDRRVMKAHAARERGDDVEIRLSADLKREGTETLVLMTKRIFTRKVIDGVEREFPVAVINGKVYKSDDAGKIALYTDHPWAREDADTFIGNMENFIPASYKV